MGTCLLLSSLLPKNVAFFCITVTGQSLWVRRSCLSWATSFLSRLTSPWWQHKTYSTHVVYSMTILLCALLNDRYDPGVSGKWKTHSQGHVHVDKVVRLLLQRVNPQLSFLPAARGGRSVSLQETLPPVVRVHLWSSPPPASCWLSRRHLGKEQGHQWILLGCLYVLLLFLKRHKHETMWHRRF